MEDWKDIPGYEGIYQASTFGRIRSTEGKTTWSRKHGMRTWKQRILKQKITANSKGRKDCRVSLWKDGKAKDWLVARLVALTFCDGFSDGMTVNHIDGDPLNNHADNLEWLTLGKNIQEAFKNGQYKTQIAYEYNGVLYRSQSQASIAMGHSAGYLANCKLVGRLPKSSLDGAS